MNFGAETHLCGQVMGALAFLMAIFSPPHVEAWLHFCPLNPCKIKRSRASEGNDQVIMDGFHQSSFLILVANT